MSVKVMNSGIYSHSCGSPELGFWISKTDGSLKLKEEGGGRRKRLFEIEETHLFRCLGEIDVRKREPLGLDLRRESWISTGLRCSESWRCYDSPVLADISPCDLWIFKILIWLTEWQPLEVQRFLMISEIWRGEGEKTGDMILVVMGKVGERRSVGGGPSVAARVEWVMGWEERVRENGGDTLQGYGGLGFDLGNK